MYSVAALIFQNAFTAVTTVYLLLLAVVLIHSFMRAYGSRPKFVLPPKIIYFSVRRLFLLPVCVNDNVKGQHIAHVEQEAERFQWYKMREKKRQRKSFEHEMSMLSRSDSWKCHDLTGMFRADNESNFVRQSHRGNLSGRCTDRLWICRDRFGTETGSPRTELVTKNVHSLFFNFSLAITKCVRIWTFDMYFSLGISILNMIRRNLDTYLVLLHSTGIRNERFWRVYCLFDWCYFNESNSMENEPKKGRTDKIGDAGEHARRKYGLRGTETNLHEHYHSFARHFYRRNRRFHRTLGKVKYISCRRIEILRQDYTNSCHLFEDDLCLILIFPKSVINIKYKSHFTDKTSSQRYKI